MRESRGIYLDDICPALCECPSARQTCHICEIQNINSVERTGRIFGPRFARVFFAGGGIVQRTQNALTVFLGANLRKNLHSVSYWSKEDKRLVRKLLQWYLGRHSRNDAAVACRQVSD